jgi:Tfp pilus assembly protein FimT
MTLLETCASIAIVSTAVVFAAPSLIRARESYHVNAVARQVAGKMQWTRLKAISRSRDCRIAVKSPISYVVECQYATWRTDESVTLPDGIRIAANASPEFHERGNVSPAATFTISDSRGNSRRVVVNITGRVRVD